MQVGLLIINANIKRSSPPPPPVDGKLGTSVNKGPEALVAGFFPHFP